MDDEFNHFDQIADALPGVLSQVVRKTAFDIQAGYQARAPRDTSFMANSAYVVTSDESTYGQHASAPAKDGYLLPEVERPDEPTTAYMAIGANYAEFPEFGTVHQPAQPALYPAVDAARGPFEDALSAVEARLKEAAQ